MKRQQPNNIPIAQYDVVVIGGGPAGLTAAIHAAARAGTHVLLLEKNRVVGKKLRITGGGRCNITNNLQNVRDLVARYKTDGKFLFSLFASHGVAETIVWLESLGIAVYEEPEGRMFPVSQSAVHVTETLLRAATEAGVVIQKGTVVTSIRKKEREFVISSPTTTFQSKTVIVATGGSARPDTGSTGDGWSWLAELGHTIESPRTALVPVAVRETALTKRLGGVALTDTGISIRVDGVREQVSRGKVLFAHFGLTGPGILQISHAIDEWLTAHKQVEILFDLCPTITVDILADQLLSELLAHPNKLIRNIVPTWIPSALAVPILEAAAVDPHTPARSITVAMRQQIVMNIKSMRFTPTGLLGDDRAIVSAGGVALTEVDFKTMESRLMPGLYIIGDVLNVDRPSGGFSLQLAWSSGAVAGQHASVQASVSK